MGEEFGSLGLVVGGGVIALTEHDGLEAGVGGEVDAGLADRLEAAIELTDQGRDEAVAARATLQHLQIAAVFSSPLRRARETAEIVGLEPDIVFDDRLLEWDYGPAEGRRSVDMREQIKDWSVWTHPDTTAETADDVGDRVDSFIGDALVGLAGDVAVFAHGHLLAVFIARWLQLAAVEGRRFKLETATVSLLGSHREDRVIRALNNRCGDRL